MFKQRRKDQFKSVINYINYFNCLQLNKALPNERSEFIRFIESNCNLKNDQIAQWTEKIGKGEIYEYQYGGKKQKATSSHNIIKLPYGKENFMYAFYKFDSNNFSIGCNSIFIKHCMTFNQKGEILNNSAGILITKSIITHKQESELKKKSYGFVSKIKNKNKFSRIYEKSRGINEHLTKSVFRIVKTSKREAIQRKQKHAERFKKKRGRYGWSPPLAKYTNEDEWKVCIAYEKVKLFKCDLNEYIYNHKKKIDFYIIVKILTLVAIDAHKHITSKNIVHNDLHPCNILLDFDENDPINIKEVKITDFDSSEFAETVVTINWGKYLAFDQPTKIGIHKLTIYDDFFGYGCLAIEVIYSFLGMENEYKKSFYGDWKKQAGRFRKSGKHVIKKVDIISHKQRLDGFIDKMQKPLCRKGYNELLMEYFGFLKQLTSIEPTRRPSFELAYKFQAKWLYSYRKFSKSQNKGF